MSKVGRFLARMLRLVRYALRYPPSPVPPVPHPSPGLRPPGGEGDGGKERGKGTEDE